MIVDINTGYDREKNPIKKIVLLLLLRLSLAEI